MTTPTTPATDVKRYALDATRVEMFEIAHGAYVPASAFDALAAELTRTQQELRKAEAERDALRTCYDGVLTKGNEVLAERDAATAEVGRLRAWVAKQDCPYSHPDAQERWHRERDAALCEAWLAAQETDEQGIPFDKRAHQIDDGWRPLPAAPNTREGEAT